MHKIERDFDSQGQNIPKHFPTRTRELGYDAPSSPVTIAGAGNPLVSYDRIGCRVLSRIIGRYGEDVELCETGTNGLDLLDIIRRQDLLIMVDACLGEGPPGSVDIIEPDPAATIRRNTSIHQISPIEALLVGQYLYPERMPQRFLLVTVNTKGLEEGEEESACERAIQALDREINAWRSAKTQPGQEECHGKQ